MKCNKCESELTGGTQFCSACGEPVNFDGEQVYMPPVYGNTAAAKKSLAKCAWFAPIAVAVSFLLGSVLELLWSGFSSWFTSEYLNEYDAHYYSIYNIISTIYSIVSFALPVVISAASFFIAAAKVEKTVKKQIMMSVFVPFFFLTATATVSSCIQDILLAVIAMGSSSMVKIVYFAAKNVLSIIAAVVSYFLVSDSFKSVDTRGEVGQVQTTAKKPLAKCAWFAPTAVAATILLRIVAFLLWLKLTFLYGTEEYSYYDSILSSIFSIVSTVLPVVISAAVFFIAAAKVEKAVKKQILMSVFVPAFLLIAASTVTVYLRDAVPYGVSFVPAIVFTIAAAVVSYFPVLALFKSVDSRREAKRVQASGGEAVNSGGGYEGSTQEL